MSSWPATPDTGLNSSKFNKPRMKTLDFLFCGEHVQRRKSDDVM